MKPGELLNDPEKAKSRWCVLGYQDPDSEILKTFAPTPTTPVIYMFLLVVQATGMRWGSADVKNAFAQGKQFERPLGKKLYVQPCEGLPLHPEQLVELECHLYGLLDAPLVWYQTVVEFFEEEGYTSCLFSPCLFTKWKDGKLSVLSCWK